MAVAPEAADQSVKRNLQKRLQIMIGGYFDRNMLLEEKLKKLASINYPAVEGIAWKDQDLGAIKSQIAAAHLDLSQIGGSISLAGPDGSLVVPQQPPPILQYLATAIAAAQKLVTKPLLVVTRNGLPD